MLRTLPLYFDLDSPAGNSVILLRTERMAISEGVHLYNSYRIATSETIMVNFSEQAPALMRFSSVLPLVLRC